MRVTPLALHPPPPTTLAKKLTLVRDEYGDLFAVFVVFARAALVCSGLQGTRTALTQKVLARPVLPQTVLARSVQTRTLLLTVAAPRPEECLKQK
ncbi:unnamed protein product [Merluccius merluccius]